MKYLITFIAALVLSSSMTLQAKAAPEETPAAQQLSAVYLVGVDDVLDISILRPEQLLVSLTVAPDGSITFPYIGTVKVKDMPLAKIQEEIQARLADGYMKYPVVSVSLKESRSRRYFVYGEVERPGAFALADNTTVLRAISSAGGFTKFGSQSRVKVLRPYKGKPGYQVIKINMNAVMNGSSNADILLQPGDIITVSKGMF